MSELSNLIRARRKAGESVDKIFDDLEKKGYSLEQLGNALQESDTSFFHASRTVSSKENPTPDFFDKIVNSSIMLPVGIVIVVTFIYYLVTFLFLKNVFATAGVGVQGVSFGLVLIVILISTVVGSVGVLLDALILNLVMTFFFKKTDSFRKALWCNTSLIVVSLVFWLCIFVLFKQENVNIWGFLILILVIFVASLSVISLLYGITLFQAFLVSLGVHFVSAIVIGLLLFLIEGFILSMVLIAPHAAV
jgi:hypothetical protein